MNIKCAWITYLSMITTIENGSKKPMNKPTNKNDEKSTNQWDSKIRVLLFGIYLQ